MCDTDCILMALEINLQEPRAVRGTAQAAKSQTFVVRPVPLLVFDSCKLITDGSEFNVCQSLQLQEQLTAARDAALVSKLLFLYHSVLSP